MIRADELDRRLRDLARIKLPLWLFDVERMRFVWANEPGLTLWQADSVDELVSRDLTSDMTRGVHERLLQHREDLADGSGSLSEHWTFYPHGEPRSHECVFSAFDIDDQKPWLLIQSTAEARTHETDTLYRSNALMHTSVCVSVFDAQGHLQYTNPAGRRMLGSSRRTLASRFTEAATWRTVSAELRRTGRVALEARVDTAAGPTWHRLTLDNCPDPLTGKNAILVSEIDVSERRAAEERVRELAYRDPLTGLGNRTTFVADLERRLDDAQRHSRRVAVYFIDLDRFKLVNDTLGHATGDRLLIAVARRIENFVGSEHRVARLGGDEFTVLASGSFTDEEAVELGKGICVAMETPLAIEGTELLVTPSIGLSYFPEHGVDPTTLMQQADLAMYDAKGTGGGLSVYTPSLNTNMRERLGLETDLRKALLREELEVFYQPKIGTRSLKVVGQEALVRWRHPTRGLIQPLDFIGIAEETGLIGQITRFVLNTAMRQQGEWRSMGFDLSVAINISPREFRSGDITATVEEALRNTGCQPQAVELEITESMLMANSDSVLDILDSMKSLGIKLSIDDFGTGYSNLGYLQKFPLDSIKVDRAFVADTDHHAVLDMIIGMGKMLSMTVVAEGVETEEQLAFLTARACDEVQGYLFSKPLPAAEATEYLRSHDAWAADPRRHIA